MTELKVENVSLNELKPGGVKVCKLGDLDLAICNVDGKLYAVQDVCSHDDGPLGEGELDGCQIECPRHGARFDVTTGKALSLPAVLPIPTYKVTVKDGEIYVSTQSGE
ncbi:MAG: non-heme iron oxygenase ferredoxin subunit [Candidatus Melainabacteria bacterium]|jgi:3-phenylpropionate/trans-cinnamate dioxygenase ferredoxin subunit|uniref:Non-heme iron oxygenase ferredoxin subunit n=1 Tax=Candidatus Obscuribacter phosphatis TaxID=1906157 RepID=A0A8J7P6P8_9BACT|nr:non-heme iron oxygenase ferredoxin subunit [Candidatus Obscuribacter phosphatis]MCA0314637.1 non-heme iron oxygenase ferredoxin subunit [Candidatus Melainabacteria bacterium]OPZ84562.1 MAG: Ferredoxin CarAc [bacterium ADurb.Bin425]